MKFNIISSLLIILTICTLQACSSILAIGTAAFVTTTTWHDPRTIGTQLDDNILTAYISYTLNKYKYIKKNTRIVNTVYQGNVLLTGQSPSFSLSEQTVQIIKNIQGTKNIYNAIRQKKPIHFKTILFDVWISNQIRLNLLINRNMHFSKIKIITEDKEVFLIGQVSRKEGQYAEKVANTTIGVKNVFSMFTYT